jgi:hypothetical protein
LIVDALDESKITSFEQVEDAFTFYQCDSA